MEHKSESRISKIRRSIEEGKIITNMDYYGLDKSLLVDLVELAARCCNIETVKNLMKFHYSYDSIIYNAAKGGHKDIVDLIISEGVRDLDGAAQGAAESGNRELLDYLLESKTDKNGKLIPGATDINMMAHYAANNGHIDLLYYLIEGVRSEDGNVMKANDWNMIARAAAASGNKKLVYDMISRGANDFDEIAVNAAYFGHKSMVYDMLSRGDYGIETFTAIAKSAAEGNYKELLEDMIGRGVNDYNGIAICATYHGHRMIVNYLIKGFMNKDGVTVGATNYKEIARKAAEYGHSTIVKDMIKFGIDNTDQLVTTAARSNCKEIVDMLPCNNKELIYSRYGLV